MTTESNKLEKYWEQQREALVTILKKKGVRDERVLAAVLQVPRHEFVDPADRKQAYLDTALSLSHQQTISQPFVVARMTEILLSSQQANNKVLEIGTGSGYQAAILANIFNEVYSIERIHFLHIKAQKLLQRLGYVNVNLRYSDGSLGWPEKSPFDAIIVTAGAEQIPQVLLEQLADGGCLVMPVGRREHQVLKIIQRHGNDYKTTDADPVIFVPLLPGMD